MKYLLLTIVCLTTLIDSSVFGQKSILVRLNDKQRAIHTVQKKGNFFKVNFDNSFVNAVLEKQNVVSFEPAFPLANKFNHPLSKKISELYRFKFESNSLDVLQQIKDTRYFDLVDEEGIPGLTFVPNDFSLQPFAPIMLNKINASGAWDITKGNSSIKIAVIDNGFDVSHQDLVNQIVYQDGNVSWSASGFSHGTPVAGLAAAQTDNGIGISSIGFNSKLMLYTLNGSIYNKMMHASLNGAKVINCSFAFCSFSQIEQDIINMITANGTVIVASAGNGNNPGAVTCDPFGGYSYPASYDNVISVSGTNQSDSYFDGPGNTLHFSFNNKVDLTAPGWANWTTKDSNNYDFFVGTSASAPMVSGTVALMLAAKSCLTPPEVEFILKSSVNKSVNDIRLFPTNAPHISTSGAGRLDALEAVKAARDWPQNATILASISGPSLVCSSGNFKVINDNSLLAPVANTVFSGSVTWSSSVPSSLSINSLTGVATRVNNYNGPATITATINSGCGNITLPALAIWVGNPLADNGTLIWTGVRGVNPVTLNAGSINYYQVDNVPGATSYTWQLPRGFTAYGSTTTTTGPQIDIITPSQVGTYSLLCRANNSCLSSWTNSLTINVVSSGGGGQQMRAAFPNPANDSFMVQLKEVESKEVAEVSLFNKSMERIYFIRTEEKEITISTSSLLPGVYYLNVVLGKEVTQKQVVISH